MCEHNPDEPISNTWFGHRMETIEKPPRGDLLTYKGLVLY
jgi:hypothetical protein